MQIGQRRAKQESKTHFSNSHYNSLLCIGIVRKALKRWLESWHAILLQSFRVWCEPRLLGPTVFVSVTPQLSVVTTEFIFTSPTPTMVSSESSSYPGFEMLGSSAFIVKLYPELLLLLWRLYVKLSVSIIVIVTSHVSLMALSFQKFFITKM